MRPSPMLRAAFVAAATACAAACGTLLPVEPDDGTGGGPEGGEAQSTDGTSPDGGDSGRAQRLVFVTSGRTKGDLRFGGTGAAGREAADLECVAEATDAGARGEFVAWIPLVGKPAIARLAEDVEWRTPSGQLVFASKADIAAGMPPRVPIVRDAKNLAVLTDNIDNRTVWTATSVTGVPTGQDCIDWSSAGVGQGRIGVVGKTDGTWTDNVDTACGAERRLICFEK